MRDGTGAGAATTPSTAWLSANWDASTDPESGIRGYQYAIGATQGGTDVVTWTCDPECYGLHADRFEPDRGPNLLLQREGRQWSGTGGQRHEFQGADGPDAGRPSPISRTISRVGRPPEGHGAASAARPAATALTPARTGRRPVRKVSRSLVPPAAQHGAYLTKNFSTNFKSPTIPFGDLYVRFYAFIPNRL